MRVRLPRAKLEVVVRVHDVGEPQADDLGLRVPAGELIGHLFTHQLGERVGRLGSLDVFGERQLFWVVRPHREAQDGLGRGPNDVPDPQLATGLKDAVDLTDVLSEGRRVGLETSGRNGSQVHDGIDATITVIRLNQRLQDLTRIIQVDLCEFLLDVLQLRVGRVGRRVAVD